MLGYAITYAILISSNNPIKVHSHIQHHPTLPWHIL